MSIKFSVEIRLDIPPSLSQDSLAWTYSWKVHTSLSRQSRREVRDTVVTLLTSS